jgi:uncharacterized membrane protein YesL
MALFGSRFTKSGPGVSKDGPQKTAFFRFFDIVGNKFFDLIKINMLYFFSIIIFCLPLIFFVTVLFSENDPAAFFLNPQNFLVVFVCSLPIAFTGPFTAGFIYLLRNFVRSEHVFLFSDYKDNVKNNFKQSTLATLINVTAFLLLIYTIVFYSAFSAKNQILLILMFFSIIVFVFFVFMNYYIYLMIITFGLKLTKIYRNAYIFSVLGIGRNILISIILFLFVIFHVLFYPYSIILIPFFSLSFSGLIISFAVWPKIKVLMIDSIQNDDNQQKDDNVERLFVDKGKER